MKLFSKILLSSVVLSSIFVSTPSFALKKDFQSRHGLNVGDKIPTFDLSTDTSKLMKFDDNFK